jgi:hypothetical protein
MGRTALAGLLAVLPAALTFPAPAFAQYPGQVAKNAKESQRASPRPAVSFR